MTAPAIPQDTAIVRAHVNMMTDDQLVELIERKRTRRLSASKKYEAGLLAKANAKSEKQAQRLDKVLGMFLKQIDAVDKAIEKLDKHAIEIQALRLVMGEDITNDE